MVAGGESGAIRNFPARIEASRRADLSFRVNGTVSKVLVKEGNAVREGQLLMQLDATDYELALKDRRAQYENAQRNFNRAKELIGNGAISKLDFDRMQAQFTSTQAAFEQAEQNVAYTRLLAPFAGVIAKRYVENFEEVQAKETVLTLHDPDSLDVKINLPDVLVRSFRKSAPTQSANVPATVQFEGRDERFALTRKEVATTADKETQTYEVTFSMPSAPGLIILPGMSATVTLDLRAVTDGPSIHWLPQTAVLGGADLSPKVSIYDNATGAVEGRSVSVGRLDGDRIEVLDGLVDGDRVVSTGVAYLAEGMNVTLMPQNEQAQPRPDDPR